MFINNRNNSVIKTDEIKKKLSFLYQENLFFLNKGIIRKVRISRFKAFIKRSSKYLPFLNEAKYIGSMFVVRSIKKNKERTDERTSSVTNHSKKIISVMSGKWNNCVYLAKHFKINH